jgi:transposase-like protein
MDILTARRYRIRRLAAHHGVSAKHLPRYLREWSYRFNRRTCPTVWIAI